MARRILHAAAFTGLCGAVGYFATDALETVLLFRTSSRLLLKHVDQDADLREQLGAPVRIGRWYNAMVSVRPGGMAANCSLSLSGTQHDANATIQISRRPSPHHSVLLYQLLGPAEWDVVAVNAMVSKGTPKDRAPNAV